MTPFLPARLPRFRFLSSGLLAAWMRLNGLALAAALAGVVMAALTAAPARAQDFLDPDEAFRLQAQTADGRLVLRFDVADGYYLYRDSLHVGAMPTGVKLEPVDIPAGEVKYDPTFDKNMEVHHHTLTITAGVSPASPAGAGGLRVGYQGCAEAGLCYPPQAQYFKLTLAPGGKVQAIEPATREQLTALGLEPAPPALAEDPNTANPAGGAGTPGAPPLPPAARPAPDNESSRIARTLQSGHLGAIAGSFLVFGLLLSFTPCVLPMLPILSAIIVGQGRPVSRRRGFVLALSYSLGMALVYAAFGVAAGLAGKGLAASLQNPWVLGSFALLLVALSLSMFGVYTLQLPASWQAGLSQTSGRLRAGSLGGVFLMGGLSALIVGPCVAAPLAGALVYISQTQDVFIGGLALFAMAAGMSVPLLLLGLSAGSLLPRVGAWMEGVKTLFGMLLLGVAWWLVQPVLPPSVALLLAGAWFALAAAFMGAFDTLNATASVLHRSLRGLGWVLAVVAAAQVVGALAGGRSLLQPLAPLAARTSGPPGVDAGAPAALPFRRIANLADLERELQAAGGRVVMLDFYADWCVACKEMEHFTFSDARVQARLASAVLLQADVTAHDAAHQALMKRFGLFGPPGILFFDVQGREIEAARVIGFQKADLFLASLATAGL